MINKRSIQVCYKEHLSILRRLTLYQTSIFLKKYKKKTTTVKVVVLFKIQSLKLFTTKIENNLIPINSLTLYYTLSQHMTYILYCACVILYEFVVLVKRFEIYLLIICNKKNIYVTD